MVGEGLKRVDWYFLLGLVLVLMVFGVLAACSTVPQTSAPVVATAKRADIIAIADASACRKYEWKERGQATKGYIEGMALVYARAECQKTVLPTTAKDALVKYGISDKSLASTYTLLTGLGMRESSGESCTGIDKSSKNYTSGRRSGDEAEAGLFQTSYNSLTLNSRLGDLFKIYQKSTSCVPEFKVGVGCTTTDAINWGSGDAKTYQALSKDCPAFATESAAVMIRIAYGHYGPLISGAAEYRKECLDMFHAVGALVAAKPGVCGEL